MASLDRLDCLLATFDFVDDISRSVALSAMLTPLFRRAMSAAPLHGFTAPVAGSGKSKLVNIAAILATGHHAPIISMGQRDEETEKRLASSVLPGDQVVSIDNAGRPLGGELLCQVVTEPLVSLRMLGSLARFVAPNITSWFATGNNLKFAGDIARRALLCRLDPKCERPELREFETPDPCLIALEQRASLVVSALTIARAFAIEGFPRVVPPLGSFADWSKWVRDPLIWLGRADLVEAMGEVRRDDPKLAALVAVSEQWSLAIGDRSVTAREVSEVAGQQGMTGFANPEFRAALLAVASRGGEISVVLLGRWLGEIKGREVSGRSIEAAALRDGVARWRLAQALP